MPFLSRDLTISGWMNGSSARIVRSSAPRISSTVGRAGGDHVAAGRRVVQQEVHGAGQHVAVAHQLGAAAVDQPLIGLAEILDVEAGKHRGVEHRRLERILAALGGQRAADEGDLGQPEIEPHLADRVAEQDVGVGFDRLVAAAPRDLQALARQAS